MLTLRKMSKLIKPSATGRFRLWILAPILFVVLSLFGWAGGAQAAVCNQNTTMVFVAADPSGSYIPNANVDVYQQATDASGNVKPGSHVAGGTTDSVLGQVSLNWKNANATSSAYAVRVRTINNDAASFWFYNINLACGETSSVTRTLSGLAISFYAPDGSVLNDANYTIYSQLRTSGGSLQQATDQSLASGNTSAGAVRVYLPQGSVRGLSSSGSDYYVMSVSHNGATSYVYGLSVVDGTVRSISYYVSMVYVQLHNADGTAAANVNLDVYKQTLLGSEFEVGDHVGSFQTNVDGYGSLEVASGMYAVGAKGPDGKYQYFWNIDVAGGLASANVPVPLTLNKAATVTACANPSNLNLTTLGVSGNIISGLKFEVYEQGLDVNGLPVVGAKVASGAIGDSGSAAASLKPDTAKAYALHVWDKRSDLGDFWFFNSIKFICGVNRNVTLTVPAVKVVLRDSAGNLKRDYDFSLSAQAYDADNNPVIADNGLIANLKTDSGGQAVVYVSPYNPYRRGQLGVYALSFKDNNGNTVNFYNITPAAGQDYVFNARASGLSGVLQDALGRALSGRQVALYSYSVSGSVPHLGSSLVSTKTDANGNFSLEYPAGTYALVANDDFNQPSAFWNIKAQAGTATQRLVMNLTNFTLADALGEALATNPTVKLYALSAGASGGYFRGQQVGSFPLNGNVAAKSLAAGPYLAVYSGKNNQDYGAAFYAASGQKQNVNIVISANSAVSATQAFHVAVPGAAVPAAGTPAVSPAAGAAASSHLRGRILLQVQSHGEAWYVSPLSGQKYYLGRPADAFKIMQALGLGISNSDFSALVNNPSSRKDLAGRILIKTQDSGQAYYFDPVRLQLYYLGRPADAWNIMRSLGLGITNANLNKIATAKQ